MRNKSFYGGQDPRAMPAYSILEAAHYLRLPPSTLRDWVKGRSYPTGMGRRFSAPLMPLPPRSLGDPLALSFFNLVEAHVLGALRREHRVSMLKVREALTCLERHFPSPHPLVDQQFETNGIDLFVETYGQLINVNQDGQLAMRDLLRMHLSRLERDAAGVPVKLYLFTRPPSANAPKVIAIDPYVAFGRPVVMGTGIATAIITERYKAVESIEDLVHDYDLPSQAIQEAIRCELTLQAA